jgi:hypothetical protein
MAHSLREACSGAAPCSVEQAAREACCDRRRQYLRLIARVQSAKARHFPPRYEPPRSSMPHAMRKFTVLGAGDELTCCRYRERSTGLDSYKEPCGTLSGDKFPDIHRGRLHLIPLSRGPCETVSQGNQHGPSPRLELMPAKAVPSHPITASAGAVPSEPASRFHQHPS